jgi:prepilin-type N-terminal cleavage/methylation domain-containing protein
MRRLSKGFTVVELIVVIFIVGVATAAAMLYTSRWVIDYRFSSATRAFINACQYARMRAIRGPISLNISQIAQGSTSTTFRLTPTGTPVGSSTAVAGFVPFTYHGTPPTGTALPAVLPITTGDYVSLAGFNTPDFLNGNLFSVTAVNVSGTAQPNGATDQYYVSLTFDCQCCDDTDPSQCLEWPSSTTSPQTTTTGKARVGASARFVATTRSVGTGSLYGTVTAGNSVQCQFDQDYFQIDFFVNGSPVTDSSKKAIVFDFAGATRNHTTYMVKIRRVENGAVVPDTSTPPVTFTVMPSGRIRIGE